MGSVRAQDELYYGGFRGKWEGQLRLIDPNAYHSEIGGGTAGQVFEASFEVSGEKVRVFWGKHRTEVKPGSFHLTTHKTNAIVYAMDSAADVMDKTGSGGWVETWTFTITHKDRNSLYTINPFTLTPFDHSPSKESSRSLASE